MRRYLLITRLAALLSIVVLGGCAREGSKGPEAEVYAAEDHDRIYREGCDLISPYMQLHGVVARNEQTEQARDDLIRGISLLQEVIKIKPDNWAAYWVMGKAYQALNQSENACDAFGRSFAIQKDNPDVAREYMFECLNLGRTAEAIDAARHGVELSPDDAGLVANLALAYLVGGQIDEAVTAVDKSLKIAPDDKITLDLRTIIHEVRDGKRPQPKSLREL